MDYMLFANISDIEDNSYAKSIENLDLTPILHDIVH